MAKATIATIDPREAEHFGKLAADWWDPRGSSAMLHRLNPARLGYIRAAVDAHWGGDGASFTPLAGLTGVDVGCGAGLLTEPLARLGAAMTGVDAAAENIGAARAHAAAGGLDIDYIAGGIEDLTGRKFDLVVSMEVIEHVSDPAAFVRGLARALAPGGLMVLSTPNRTPLSKLAMITVGEGTGMIPKGTHDWNRFLNPEELEALLSEAGLRMIDRSGLSFSPARGFVTSPNEALNYLVTAVRA
ncbi:MAG: bifunctional 2-polyprenyl-6-hydroxyphenol methylase/3-demethylubiquinol 3-O-methyltransferase UbiG [Sphingomonas sp.]|uniref:bifunctional 2-polyprenyl-6-hydroxyphenol methylase/3-demethylubiquinol 3-O-methyltransferase UbiG n=1 Tax=Sphingomonas sp. TaxID=28214 RepID=UPI0025D92322|nr:bifunctional 2-polyprenyl-6-hydroxyphenol methylase/3-demethylubiquinol 3-O-methyltransferase UbiG [Sphingomonas sp.]MBX3565496.1 bifunctional 2-polyprenyl-6-hydroxyphenol methylase/3-demethylubiquinol 3-O-methyltransferase UbiG [Sphingomonas sp.]